MKKLIIFLGMLLLTFPLTINAATANINIVNNPKSISKGGTITSTVTVSSSSKLGTVDFYLSYTDNLTLLDGDAHKVDRTIAGKTSVSYTYKFKASGSGNAKVYIENKNIMDVNGEVLTTTISPSTTVVSAASASNLSNNNILASLEVVGFELLPKFSKDVESYDLEFDETPKSITIKAEAEDKKATVTGTGKFELKEGENIFEVKCTAQNGKEKSYFITALVEDQDIINIKVNGKKYIIVKDEKTLEEMAPENYDKTSLKIDGIEVPALKGSISKLYLVVAKNTEDDFILVHFDKKNMKYYKYIVSLFGNRSLYVMNASTKPKGFEKTRLLYNDEDLIAYVDNKEENIYYLYAMDVNTGKKNWYKYNSKTEKLESTNLDEDDYMLFCIIGGIILILLVTLLVILIKKCKK